jgi:long-chain acyl-CoA synthetase
MPAPSLDKSQNRSHLGTLVADMERWGAAGGTAVVDHRGVRRFATGYRELAATARRFAAELEARGIGTGERVVLWGANGALWTSVFFGCVLRGALVVPLDTSGSAEFAERILREVTPKLIMGDRALLGKLGRNDYAQIALEDLGQLLASRDEATAAAGLSGDTPLQILFTSGTTGEPKGVVHTHRNLLASIARSSGRSRSTGAMSASCTRYASCTRCRCRMSSGSSWACGCPRFWALRCTMSSVEQRRTSWS